ncbi:MAG: hypothetical protein KF861_12225 [Planctomycetaceae bacterium]|nr:hypothetical protein [Planctomycetaceae bacterium]
MSARSLTPAMIDRIHKLFDAPRPAPVDGQTMLMNIAQAKARRAQSGLSLDPPQSKPAVKRRRKPAPRRRTFR